MTSGRWALVVAVTGGVGLAVMARTPEAGALWRVGFVALSLAGAGALVVAQRRWRPSRRTVWLGAVLLRLTVLPLGPTLSDDGYRYLWDGLVQVEEHASPYRWRPSDPALSAYHDEPVYRRMNSPSYYSVYPPVSQAVFALSALAYPLGWKASWIVLKVLVGLGELVGVWCLLRLVAPHRAALYAWHPLAVVEVAGQGHTEGLLVGCLALTLLALSKKRGGAAGWLALGGWVKLYPFALLPVAWRSSSRRGRVAAVLIIIAGAVPLVVGESWSHVRDSLRLYVGTFDFYSAPYLLAKLAAYPVLGERAGPLAAGVLGAVGLVAVGGVTLTADGTRQSARRALGVGVVALTLTATALHPWYWLAPLLVLPLLDLKLPLFWIASTASATYLSYLWPPTLWLVTWIGWGGGLALVLYESRRPLLAVGMRLRARSKADRLLRFLGPVRSGGRLLDLGAGEGFVGREIASRRGIGVQGLDVVRFPTALPSVRTYDGRHIPYADDAFDAAVVVFTLHHAADALAVALEAVRVTSGPVVVLETVHTGTASKRWLERLDRWLNRLRSGGSIDESVLDIRSDADWRRLFEEQSLEIVESATWGGLHPQALYVLQTPETKSSTRAVPASSRTAVS